MLAFLVMEKLNLLLVKGANEAPVPLVDKMPPGVHVTEGDKPEDFAAATADADVILSWAAKKGVLESLLRDCKKLKWIHSRSAGLDSLLFPELVASPIPLTNGRGVFSQSLGEFVLLRRALFREGYPPHVAESERPAVGSSSILHEIAGQTMGIVGYGDIGRACAWRAKAMGMKVLAVRRRPEQSAGDPNVEHVYGFDGLLEMVKQCDYVVAAAPLTPQTKSLVSKEVFAAMKPTAIVMNVGRGPVIDEPAMLEALTSKQIRGAALDVFTTEPLPPGHPFYSMENVLLSPHCADNTQDWLDQAMLFFYRNLDHFIKQGTTRKSGRQTRGLLA